MTRRARALTLLPAAALGLAVLTGCGQHGQSTGAASPGSTSPAPSASQLARMQQLVNGADSAAAAAESDAAADK